MSESRDWSEILKLLCPNILNLLFQVLLAVDEVLLEIMTQESTTSTFSLMANILSESISVDIPEDAEKSTVMRCCIESLSQLFQKMHHRDVSKVI